MTACIFPRFKVIDRRERPHQWQYVLMHSLNLPSQLRGPSRVSNIIKEPTVKFPKNGHNQEHQVASSVKGGKQDFSIHKREIPHTVYMTTN